MIRSPSTSRRPPGCRGDTRRVDSDDKCKVVVLVLDTVLAFHALGRLWPFHVCLSRSVALAGSPTFDADLVALAERF